MGWLAKIPFGRGGTAVAEAEREDANSTPATSGPQLMVLVNDASGRASFKTHVFDDAESATEWVRYWFPLEAEDGMTAFWAMTEQPEGGLDIGAEPLVMISDTSRDGVVYLFSFVDIESAQTFLREEVERGTQPDTMFFYWAVQVKREIDRFGKLALTPSTPPGVTPHEAHADAFESDGWVVQGAPEVEKEPAKTTGNARALMEEAPNAGTGVAEPNGPGQETFELTSWMERARKSPPRQRDVIAIAAEVVAASEESFEEEMAAEAKPEPAVEGAVVVQATVEAKPEPAVEDAAVVETAVEEEPEPVSNGAVVVEAAVEEGSASAFEDALEVEKSDDADDHAISEAVPAEESPADDRALRVRAATNGNGHKSPSAHEVVVEINGHKSAHQVPAEATDGESPVADEPRPVAGENALLPTNGNGAANGHARQVTSPHGEGTPAIERPLDNSDAEAGDASDQTPAIVHDVRIETATNGRDETVNIQIGIHLQSRALTMKRWEAKDEPFEGFKSPPGRF